jgi:hypothetical protein
MKRIFVCLFLIFPLLMSGFSQNCLFKKYKQNPLFNIGSNQPFWRTVHVANATILTPEETGDGTWRIYARGNGYAPNNGGQIGIIFQDTLGFSPLGGWQDYENNPVLSPGPSGTYDDKALLDCAPVVGENGDIYFYYKGKNTDGGTYLAGSKSSDGGYTLEKFDTNPLLSEAGINDVIYYDQKYYIYYGRMLQGADNKWTLETYLKIASDPKSFSDLDSIKVLPVGGGPDNFDSRSVHGTRIFRLQDKWYMVYQGSNQFIDFPDRFHAAYSVDLINWTKIDNDYPLFTRGFLGEWDQGAMWYGEVFEYKDTLYMLYEGWGCYCIPETRDTPYFPGNSRTGIAQVSVEDFLLWADGGFDSSWIYNEIGPDGTIADFENYSPIFYPTNNMMHEIVTNPFKDDVNPSDHVGKIVSTYDRWELLWYEFYEERFDFSKGNTFKMKVFSEVPGNIYFKIENPTDYTFGQMEVKQYLSTTNEWVEMEFDFTPFQPSSELFGKILLLFDAGNTEAGNVWYFDDLEFNTRNYPLALKNYIEIDNKLKVLYNSVNQSIVLEGTGFNDRYEIYSIEGRLIKDGFGNDIDVSDLKKGIYVLRSGANTVKFIK